MRGSLVSTYEITYQDIHELLTGFGFSLEIRVPERSVEVEPPRETLVYRHEKQGTVLKFPSKANKPALYVETHIHYSSVSFTSVLKRTEYSRPWTS